MSSALIVSLVAVLCSLLPAPVPSTLGPAARQQAPPASSQAASPRDTATRGAGTAVLRGRVTSAGMGHPLHRVRITLNGSAPNLPAAVTDSRGTFELTSVPSGTYSITAARAGYLSRQYGQARPRQPGRSVTVADGEVVEGLDIQLSRGGVLAGRLYDELGDPLSGARVEAVELRYLRGRRVAVPAAIARSNDEGDYRLSGLEPGAYQVRAASTDVWEGEDARTTHAYAVTFYPGVTAADRPQSLKVGAGEQVAALDFRVVAARASRITGVVEGPGGGPLGGEVVRVSEIGRTIGGALMSSGPGPQARTDAHGRFDFPGLAPGEYLVYAGGPKERAGRTVRLEHNAVEHVVLSPRTASTAMGTIVTEDGTGPPFAAASVRVEPVSADPGRVLQEWSAPSAATVRPDWTFQIGNMDGDYLFRVVGLPDGWMLGSVLVRGRDVVDSPVRVLPGSGDLEAVRLVLCRKGASISGEVIGSEGRAGADATVVVFSDDPAKWGPGSRFVRAARPDRRGRFAAGALPGGVYRLIARADVVEGQWEDPEFLESLRTDAVRIDLAEGASETITVTVDGKVEASPRGNSEAVPRDMPAALTGAREGAR